MIFPTQNFGEVLKKAPLFFGNIGISFVKYFQEHIKKC